MLQKLKTYLMVLLYACAIIDFYIGIHPGQIDHSILGMVTLTFIGVYLKD